jgi:hypothetical protein
MCQRLSEDRIRLGVTNPDLGLLPSDAPTPDFRFISQNENQYLPSRPRSVDIVLRGSWQFPVATEGGAILATSGRQTTIRCTGVHGMTVRVELVRR